MAFDSLKNSMINAAILTPFDPELPDLLRMDASNFGLRACLFMIQDGSTPCYIQLMEQTRRQLTV